LVGDVSRQPIDLIQESRSRNPEITRRGTETLQTKTTLVLLEAYMMMHSCSVEITTDVFPSVFSLLVYRWCGGQYLLYSEILHSKN